jgi:hypothetical protein
MTTNHAKVVLINDGGARSDNRLVDGLCQTNCIAQAGDAATSRYKSARRTLPERRPGSLLEGVERIPKVPHKERLAPLVLSLPRRVLFFLAATALACFLFRF